jgi:hypothetical protein
MISTEPTDVMVDVGGEPDYNAPRMSLSSAAGIDM